MRIYKYIKQPYNEMKWTTKADDDTIHSMRTDETKQVMFTSEFT
jgi:hypothetical protein